MNAIPTDFNQLAHAIAIATVRSDIEVYASRVTVDGHDYWDTTRARRDSENPDEDLAYLQRAVAYIDQAADVLPQRMLRHIASPGLVRFVKREPASSANLTPPEVQAALQWCAFDLDECTATVAFDTEEETRAFIRSHIMRKRVHVLPEAIRRSAAAVPTTAIKILIEWLFRRFGAPIDAGELPNPVVIAVREIERWLNPLLPMPEAPR